MEETVKKKRKKKAFTKREDFRFKGLNLLDVEFLVNHYNLIQQWSASLVSVLCKLYVCLSNLR